MELPSWFLSAIEHRIEQVTASMERQPEIRKLRVEEREAFDAMFPDADREDRAKLSTFMDWEDKHHFKRAIENECLYLQGMRDGVQLIAAMLSDPKEG